MMTFSLKKLTTWEGKNECQSKRTRKILAKSKKKDEKRKKALRQWVEETLDYKKTSVFEADQAFTDIERGLKEKIVKNAAGAEAAKAKAEKTELKKNFVSKYYGSVGT